MLLTRDVLIDPDSSVDEGKFIVKKARSDDQSAALINISLFLERGKETVGRLVAVSISSKPT